LPDMSYSLAAIVFTVIIAAVAWLLGLGLLARLGVITREPCTLVIHLLATTTGIACVTFMLFVLAALGQLKPAQSVLAGFLALAISAYWLFRANPGWWREVLTDLSNGRRFCIRKPFVTAIMFLVCILVLLYSLGAPLDWDEMAYHLPYARDWVNAGEMVVSERMRFPLHAFNIQLLWAAALMFSSEAATHLLNAFMTGLLVLGVFDFCRRRYSKATAVVATILCLYLFRNLIDTAYVDIGLSLFVFCAFLALDEWLETRKEAFLVISAFLLAAAAASKYQGLLQLLLFVPALAFVNRNATSWFRVIAVLLVFGTWWYIRNAWISGDPFHPLGGRIFGFWLWNESDLAWQHQDFARYRHHLPWLLTPALFFVFLPGKRRPMETILVILGLAGLMAWYLTSRYERYLLPTVPFLAILASRVLVYAAQQVRISEKLRSTERAKRWRLLRHAGSGVIVLAAVIGLIRQWEGACFTYSCVDRIYSVEMKSWPVVRTVEAYPNLQVYQYGLENELYFLGGNSAGDWFGFYRYRNIWDRINDPAAISGYLQQLGRDSILVNRSRHPFSEFPATAALADHFDVLYEDESVALYQVKR